MFEDFLFAIVVKVKKSKIAPKQLGQIDQTEYLDDSTVDDVLENTESLLDNVEEMLNSLDSQLDDSDEGIKMYQRFATIFEYFSFYHILIFLFFLSKLVEFLIIEFF